MIASSSGHLEVVKLLLQNQSKVKIIDNDEFWLSSESEAYGKPRLFRLKLKSK